MRKHGFTMIELVIAMSLMSFMMMVAYGVLKTGNTIYTNDTIYLDMQQQARNGMDRIVREVRESSSTTVTVIDANSDRLTFTTPNETGLMYYRSGTNLVREYPSGTLKNVASNIAYLKFTLSTYLLTINIRADKAYGTKTISFALTERVRTRN